MNSATTIIVQPDWTTRSNVDGRYGGAGTIRSVGVVYWLVATPGIPATVTRTLTFVFGFWRVW